MRHTRQDGAPWPPNGGGYGLFFGSIYGDGEGNGDEFVHAGDGFLFYEGAGHPSGTQPPSGDGYGRHFDAVLLV